MNNQPDIAIVMHLSFLLLSVEYQSAPGVLFMFLVPTFCHRFLNSEAEKDFSKQACPLQELEVLGALRALEIKFTWALGGGHHPHTLGHSVRCRIAHMGAITSLRQTCACMEYLAFHTKPRFGLLVT